MNNMWKTYDEEVSISISFDQLKDVKKHLLQCVNNIYVGKCTAKTGYIVKIEKVTILDNIISRVQPVVIISIIITYLCFNPLVNDILKCKIDMMMPDGIWTKLFINDKITICVGINKNHINKKWNGSVFEGLKKNDIVNVKILNILFDGNIKKYIGVLI